MLVNQGDLESTDPCLLSYSNSMGANAARLSISQDVKYPNYCRSFFACKDHIICSPKIRCKQIYGANETAGQGTLGRHRNTNYATELFYLHGFLLDEVYLWLSHTDCSWNAVNKCDYSISDRVNECLGVSSP